MPVKIGFSVVSSTGEDERYRATDLNYHGPTVKGWRSAQWCHYPQDITFQLHFPSIIHRIQILAHQYLIPQKIEIWTCEDLEYDPSVSPSGLQCFQYLGFITLSNNEATAFKSRELKSVTTPATLARFLRLRLYENYTNERNTYNQVGLVAVSVLGELLPQAAIYEEEENNNEEFTSIASDATLMSNPQYTSPYDDLAFEMYVDKDVARIMRLMENKKHHAVLEERFEYARKLKLALQKLREAGEVLGRYEQEKRQAINLEEFDVAKLKKNQIEKFRDQTYTSLNIEQLLELEGPMDENDSSSASIRTKISNPVEQQQQPHHRDENDSCDSPSELEIDTSSSIPKPLNQIHPSPQHFLQAYQEQVHPSWSPQHPPPARRTSLTDCSSLRSHSPKPMTHSFSHSSFHSTNPMPQFQCYTPYSIHNLNLYNQPDSHDMYQSLPPIMLNEPFYLAESKTYSLPHQDVLPRQNSRTKSPEQIYDHNDNNNNLQRANSMRGSVRKMNKPVPAKNTYEDYEERMLPALRHPQIPNNEVLRECQLAVEQTRKSKLNEREKKQAALPITVFGIELVEGFYSKHFSDKEEGLKRLQDELKSYKNQGNNERDIPASTSQFSANKVARAAIFLLHRALRDKVYSVYCAAADAIRYFFNEFVPGRVSSAETARSVEKLLPELMTKSGDVTPRIHNLAAHTLLSMMDCKQVRDLHIIPVHLSRPLSSSVHPRLALSRLEMIEQIIINHGISTEKQSGLTCRTLAEFGATGLHHPAEAVRKVSERVLLQVYKVNPRIIRKQLPPDDDVTRRNLLYRQLFHEFDMMDIQRRREQEIQEAKLIETHQPQPSSIQPKKRTITTPNNIRQTISSKSSAELSEVPKRITKPAQNINQLSDSIRESNDNRQKSMENRLTQNGNGSLKKRTTNTDSLLPRRNMSRISEETNDVEEEKHLVQFPNLIDSVHVTENRLSMTQNNNHKINQFKYIFPTTYIGNANKNHQEQTRNSSMIPRSNVKDQSKRKIPQISGIPIPKNTGHGRNKSLIALLMGSKKCGKTTGIPMKIQKENSMTKSVYMGNGNLPVMKCQAKENAVMQPSDVESPTYKMCIFCLEKKDWFTEEHLNMHYWEECPMLTTCSHCKEVVEISGLTQHRIDDCEFREKFIKCQRCQEAILKEDHDSHSCKCCTSGNGKLRCPMCHFDLPGEQGWRNHLMGESVCTNHPRKSRKI